MWSYAEENAFLKAAPPSLRLAMMLLIYTAQRPSDVLGMTKGRVSEHDGRLWIILRQQKTGELIEVPLHDRLAPLVRSRLADDSGGLLLVPSPTGSRGPTAILRAPGMLFGERLASRIGSAGTVGGRRWCVWRKQARQCRRSPQ